MEIRTGYFAKLKKYTELGYVPIGIVRFKPKWYSYKNKVTFAPSIQLLSSFKDGNITSEEFSNLYIEETKNNNGVLKFKEMVRLYKTLGVEKIILLCFEKSEDTCHRHVLAEYLNKELNLNISELIV